MATHRSRLTGRLSIVAVTLALTLSPRLPIQAQEEPPSIENLMAALTNGNDRERRDAAYRLNNLGRAAEPAIPALIKALDDDEQQVWFYSLMALANLGPTAKDAVPRLMKGLAHGSSGRRGSSEGPSQTWYRSAYALGKIGEPAVKDLIEGLKSEDARVRSGATKALSWVQPQPTSVIPALIDKLNDPDATVRRYAAETLGEFGTAALPALKEALARTETRTGAAVAIGWMGRDAIDATPQLAEALKAAGEPEAKGECINALSRLRYDPTLFVPLLFDSIRTDDLELRQTVINAILLIRPAEQQTVLRLVEMLPGTKEESELAALLLGRIGDAAGGAVPSLIERAESAPDDSARSHYTLALTRIGAPAIPALLKRAEVEQDLQPDHWTISTISNMGEPAVAALLTALADGIPSLQQTVILCLKAIGLQAQTAAEPLSKLFTTPNPPLQAAALSALAAIGADLTPLLPVMEEELSSASPLLRSSVAEAAATMGTRAEVLGTALRETLADKDPQVRARSALALASILPQNPETVTLLSKATADPEPEVQAAAIQALGSLGAAAEPALQLLIGSAGSGPTPLRTQSLTTLGKIGPAAATATPVIEEALTDPDPSIRSTAIRALRLVETNREKLVTRLRTALQDQENPVRHSAIEALRSLGRDGRPATPELFSLLDTDQDRPLVLETLRRIQVNSVEHLIDALGHKEASVRSYACGTLGRLGSAAREAIPRLRELRDDPSRSVAREARDAIRNIERD